MARRFECVTPFASSVQTASSEQYLNVKPGIASFGSGELIVNVQQAAGAEA
jgi:hypothetical protein